MLLLILEVTYIVVDTFNQRVQKFSTFGPQAYVLKFGTSGTDKGEFDKPEGIAIDPNGDLLVVDTYNNRIQKFSNAGKYITKWGKQGASMSSFSRPKGIALDSHKIYIADSLNHRITIYVEVPVRIP